MFLLKHGNVGLTCLAFSPDGSSLAAGGYRGTVLLWDLGAKRLRWKADHRGGVDHSAVTFVGGRVLTLSDRRLYAFDAATGERVEWQTEPRRDGLTAMAADGVRLVVATRDPARSRTTVFGHALPGGERRWHARPVANDLSVTAMAISGDGRLAASGTFLGTLDVFDAATGRRRHDARCHGMAEIKAIAFAPDGGSVAWCAGAHVYRCRLSPEPGPVSSASLGRTHFLSVAWHPSGGFFATANGDGKVDYWDALTGERRESFDWQAGKLHDITFDAAGDRAACCSKTGHVVVWDVDR